MEAHDSLSTAVGTLSLDFAGNYVFDFDQAVTDTSPSVDIVNTVANPLALRLRGTVGWSREGPQLPGPAVYLAVNYTGGYKNPGSLLMPDVSPWTTLDLRAVYRTPQGSGWLERDAILTECDEPAQP